MVNNEIVWGSGKKRGTLRRTVDYIFPELHGANMRDFLLITIRNKSRGIEVMFWC